MLKTICFCDRCGAQIDGNVGYVAVNSHVGSYDGDLIGPNPYEDRHFCSACMDLFIRVIEGDKSVVFVSEYPPTITLTGYVSDEKPAEEEPAPMLTPEQIEDEVHDIQKKIEEAAEPDPEENNENDEPEQPVKKKPGRKKKIEEPAAEEEFTGKVDTGKVQALRGAGWKLKDIADDMHLPLKVVQEVIYSSK